MAEISPRLKLNEDQTVSQLTVEVDLELGKEVILKSVKFREYSAILH